MRAARSASIHPCACASSRWSRGVNACSGGSPTSRTTSASSSVKPSGVSSAGGLGRRVSSSRRRPSTAACSSSTAFSSSLTRPSSSSCSGDGLPFSFVLARRSVDARLELAPLRVDRHQLVERVRGALPLRAPSGSRRDRCALHGCRSSRQECLNHLRDTLLVRGGTDEIGARLHRRVRVSDRDGEPGPVDELDVVLAVPERDRPLGREAEAIRDELETGALRDLRVRELEEERQRLRDEQLPGEARAQRDAEAVELLRVADDDELRRLAVEPVQQRRRRRGARCAGRSRTTRPRASRARRRARRPRSS